MRRTFLLEDTSSGNKAEILAIRLMTGLIALVALVELFVAVPPIVVDARGSASPQLIVGAGLGIGLPLLAGIVAIRGNLRWLKRLNGATALGHIALTLGWVFFFHSDGQSLGVGVLWILASGPSIAAATMAWGAGAASLVLLVTSVFVPIINILQLDRADHTVAFIDGLSSLTLAVAFAGVIVTLLSAARALDRQALSAGNAARLSAESRATARSEQETNDVIHDDILSTLMFASRNSDSLRQAVANQASQALTAIDELTRQTEDELHPLTLAEFVSATTSLCRACATSYGVEVDITVTGKLTEPLPPQTSQAILAALSQAVVNSLLHAGADRVNREVSIRASPRGIMVVLTDDGAGFDSENVPSDRLGLRHSISGRMNALPGGASEITSRVGEGTSVSLSWNAANDQGRVATPGRSRHFAFSFKRHVTWVVASAFLLCNVLICTAQIATSTSPIPSLVALTCIVACFGVFGISSFRPPSPRRTLLIVMLTVVAASMQFFLPGEAASPRVSSWYLASLAAILLVLVFQHHAALAWSGMVALVAIVCIAAVARDAVTAESLGVAVRPILILTFGSIFVIPLNIFQTRIMKLRFVEQEQLADKAFAQTARAERHTRALRLKRDVGPLLATLSLGTALNPDHVAQCRALEGSLRDDYRGHRLTQPSLVTVARNARIRGVDVVLLDDARGTTLLASEILAINTWMAESLEHVESGQFTGRILPADRAELATIVIHSDGTETDLSFIRSNAIAPSPL